MRQIEKQFAAAFAAGRPWSLSNSAVVVSGVFVYAYLHNNLIARKNVSTGRIDYSCAGWHTVTTASRLRCLGLDCHIKNGVIIMDRAGVPVPSSLNK